MTVAPKGSLELICSANKQLAGVVPIGRRIRELQRRADELNWEGDFDRADPIYERIRELVERQEKGDMYDVDF